MSAQTTAPERTAPPDAERIYAVPAEQVAQFYELMDAVRAAPIEEIGDSAKAELLDLWGAANHMVHALETSKIYKVKFR